MLIYSQSKITDFLMILAWASPFKLILLGALIAQMYTYMRDSIISGTSDDIFLEIWDYLNIVKNLNTCQFSFLYWHGVVSRA